MTPWPFVPLARMSESIVWATDTLRARGSEQRRQLLPLPQQGFRFGHAFRPQQLTRARALVRAVGRGEFGVPVWPEHTALGSVPAGTGTLSFDTTVADYRPGGHALLWQDDETFEAVEVDTVAAGSLTLAGITTVPFSAAIVVPLRAAHALDGMGTDLQEPDEPSSDISFTVPVGTVLDAPAGLDSYRSADVLTDVPIVAGGLAGGVQFAIQPVGDLQPYYAARYSAAVDRASVRWDVATAAELWAVRRWLHSRRGRAVPFWLPTWGRDLELLAPIGAADTTLTVRAVGWAGMAEPRDVMIRSTAGARYYRRVSAAAAGGGGEVLTINAALGVALSLAQVDRISLLHHMRQSADRVEIEHQRGLGAVIVVECEETPE
jgi:hypothetical protein